MVNQGLRANPLRNSKVGGESTFSDMSQSNRMQEFDKKNRFSPNKVKLGDLSSSRQNSRKVTGTPNSIQDEFGFSKNKDY